MPNTRTGRNEDHNFYEERNEAFEKFDEMLTRLENEGRITPLEKVLGSDCKWDLTENNEDFVRGHVDYIFADEDKFVEALKYGVEVASEEINGLGQTYSPEDFNFISHEYLEAFYEKLHELHGDQQAMYSNKKNRKGSVYEVATGVLGETPKTELMTLDLLTALQYQWKVLKRFYSKDIEKWNNFAEFYYRVETSEYKDEENGGRFSYRCYQYYSLDEVYEICVKRYDLK